MIFNYISTEVLELILLHLPKKEIRNASLVSPRFNDVISNSPRLMEAFTVTWTQENDKDNFTSNRRYRNVDFKSPIITTPFIRFIDNHRTTLKRLRFRCSLENRQIMLNPAPSLIKVLRMLSENLESLQFQAKLTTDDLFGFGGNNPIAFRKLKCLTMRSGYKADGSLMSMFHAAKLIEFEDLTYARFVSQENVARWAEFFEAQTQLEKLDLSSSMFQDGIMDKASFKLTELKYLGVPSDSGVSFIDFGHFLQSQMSSLRVLSLAQTTINGQLMRKILLLNLKCLNLQICTLRWEGALEVTNTSIQILSFSRIDYDPTENCLKSVLGSCQNVEAIGFLRTDIWLSTYMHLAQNMPKLYYLRLGPAGYKVKVVTFESVKILDILQSYDRKQCESTALMLIANKHLRMVRVNENFKQNQTFAKILYKAKFPSEIIKYVEFDENQF